jgi:hypothetical protein
VRLWNIARTNEQIKKDRGANPDGAEPGLIAYYYGWMKGADNIAR